LKVITDTWPTEIAHMAPHGMDEPRGHCGMMGKIAQRGHGAIQGIHPPDQSGDRLSGLCTSIVSRGPYRKVIHATSLIELQGP
jgi:hypothetical protein